MDITRAVAEKVRDAVDAGLVSGVGVQIPGQMCVEAAVCYALGLPHGDDPGCVSAPLRVLNIRLNDGRWSSPLARAAGLRRLAVAQLGSRGVLDEREFVRRVVELSIRRVVPRALRAAATVNPEHAKALEAAAVKCEREGTREAAQEARQAAATAAYSATAAYAAYADAAAAYAAAAYAATAAYAAYAAYADAATAAYAAYAAYAYAAARVRDRTLAEFAEWVVEILIDMDAPGCQWLDLVPKAEQP